MEINLFSKCIRELIVENDRVDVPYLGTFTAEMVPAAYSDRQTTIHPPYRKMSFHKGEVALSEGKMLLDKVSAEAGVSLDQAGVELGWCLSRLCSELEGSKNCKLPGLGVMRANSRNEFFFVPDDDLDIWPDGLGFEPISIKISEKPHKSEAIVEPEPVPKQEPEATFEEPEPEAKIELEPVVEEPDPEPVVAEPEATPDEPEPEATLEPEATHEPEATPDEPEPEATPEPESAPEPAAEPAAQPAAQPVPEPTATPVADPAPVPAPLTAPAAEPAPHRRRSSRRTRKTLRTILIVLGVLVVLFIAASYLFTEQMSPILDPLLYSKEELELLGR